MAYVLKNTQADFQDLGIDEIVPLIDPREKEEQLIHSHKRTPKGLLFPCILPQAPRWTWFHVFLFSDDTHLFDSPLLLKSMVDDLQNFHHEGIEGRLIGIQLFPSLTREVFPSSYAFCKKETKDNGKETIRILLPISLVRCKREGDQALTQLLHLLFQKGVSDEEKLGALRCAGIRQPEDYRFFHAYRKKKEREQKERDLYATKRLKKKNMFLSKKPPSTSRKRCFPANSKGKESPMMNDSVFKENKII